MRIKVITILIVLLLLTPFFLWYLRPSSEKTVLILDKTVLDKRCAEHELFNWILTHQKITKINGEFYDKRVDYKGFFPKEDKQFIVDDMEKLSFEEIKTYAESLDILYYTDTYGIYTNEWNGNAISGDRSEKIYGGLTNNDYLLLESALKKKKLCITEFNILASPTNGAVRRKTEKLLGIKWSGWVGRYFHDLDTITNPELPQWVINNYEEQYKENWDFHLSGLVFVHESEKIIILEDNSDLSFTRPTIHTNEKFQKIYNVKDSIAYPFWFDIVSSDTNNVISEYHLHLTSRGEKKLAKFNIPSSFPAFIGNYKHGNSYYLAGDFCDNDISFIPAYYRGVYPLRNWMASTNDPINRKHVFWEYYFPAIKSILRQNEMYSQNFW